MSELKDRLRAILAKPLPFLADGRLVHEGDVATITNPATRQPVGSYVTPTTDQIDEALSAARRAFRDGWRQTSAAERAAVLLAIRDAFAEHAEELAGLDAIEVGKPITSSKFSDTPLSIEALEYFADRAKELEREESLDVGDPAVSHRGRYEPYGVVLEVLPWNGPLWTGVQRMAAILAAGNVAVMKPASWAAASWAYLGTLVADLVPPGVLTILPGPGSTVGATLVNHPLVQMISLTGGTETGRRVLAETAKDVKRVSLELGGKNPNLVLADADIDKAVRWSTMGAFSNSGQVCVCGSRILVHDSVADEFTEKLVRAAGDLRLGDPLEPDTTTGPVVSESQFKSIWDYIESTTASGEGRLVAGGRRYDDGPLAEGYFVPPTVFVDVPPTCRMFREEIFGPVVSITRFNDLDEAIELANNTEYGLAAGVFTEDPSSADYVADRLEAGQVYVNQWFSPGVLQAPSHGYKQSGIGGVGIEKYLQKKNVFVRTE